MFISRLFGVTASFQRGIVNKLFVCRFFSSQIRKNSKIANSVYSTSNGWIRTSDNALNFNFPCVLSFCNNHFFSFFSRSTAIDGDGGAGAMHDLFAAIWLNLLALINGANSYTLCWLFFWKAFSPIQNWNIWLKLNVTARFCDHTFFFFKDFDVGWL